MFYHRCIRTSNAPPPLLPPLPPPGAPPLVPPPKAPLPDGHILYGIEYNRFLEASTISGRIMGHPRRLSPETLSALRAAQRKARQRRGNDNNISVYFDKDSVGYDWLCRGWVAEKRRTSYGAGYSWLYYDPLGRQYRSKRQVLRFWQEQDRYFQQEINR